MNAGFMMKNSFNSGEYWENRYKVGKTSGAGSYNALAEFKAEIINKFISDNGIIRVVEWGCGDGNQLSYMDFADYLGLDVSPEAIGICRKKFADDGSKRFSLIDENFRIGREFDLALSLDVIFHLVEDAVFEKYMLDLFSSSNKYVCVYSSDSETPPKLSVPVKHVKHRKFTKFIEENIADFTLVENIKNRYPFNAINQKRTSFADFYFYRYDK